MVAGAIPACSRIVRAIARSVRPAASTSTSGTSMPCTSRTAAWIASLCSAEALSSSVPSMSKSSSTPMHRSPGRHLSVASDPHLRPPRKGRQGPLGRRPSEERNDVTVTHDSIPMGTSTLDGTFDHLRDHGVRLTAARRLVIEALFATDRPISAEEIASGVGGGLPRSDVASVYRNLETLQRMGLVRHVHLGHNAGRYRMA